MNAKILKITLNTSVWRKWSLCFAGGSINSNHSLPESGLVKLYQYPKKLMPFLLGEVPDSRPGAGNMQDEPGTSYHTRKQGKTS